MVELLAEFGAAIQRSLEPGCKGQRKYDDLTSYVQKNWPWVHLSFMMIVANLFLWVRLLWTAPVWMMGNEQLKSSRIKPFDFWANFVAGNPFRPNLTTTSLGRRKTTKETYFSKGLQIFMHIPFLVIWKRNNKCALNKKDAMHVRYRTENIKISYFCVVLIGRTMLNWCSFQA